jgi:hypothetical protein
MTRSENMTRLWQDPAFRARRIEQSSQHMTRLNSRQWKDPKFVARSTERILSVTKGVIIPDYRTDTVSCETTAG